MNKERQAEIAKLAEAATPGPWTHVEHGDEPADAFRVYMRDGQRIDVTGDSGEAFSNAAFIACARTAIPELLAAVKERDSKVRGLSGNIRSLIKHNEKIMANERAALSRLTALESVREAAEAYCTASRALEVATENDWPIKDKIPLGMACGSKVDALRSALSAAKEGE